MFNNPMQVRVVLETCGFDFSRIRPPFGELTPIEYWFYIFREIDHGKMADGYRVIVTEALRYYPYNSMLMEVIKNSGNSSASASHSETAKQYRFFFSCNSKDRVAVERIRNSFGKEDKDSIWYYVSDMRPSSQIVNALEEIITTLDVAVIFYSLNGKGPWQDMEIAMCIDQFARRKMKIVPIILPEATAEHLPLVLRQFDAINCNHLSNDEVVKEILSVVAA